MSEQTKKELYKAIYNGGLDVLKLSVRDWPIKDRAKIYALLESLKK